MTVHSPRYSMEEFARRGTEIYERDIRPQVEAGNKGKIVAIDIETGDYELAEDTLAASDSLYARVPDAQIWCVRIGHRAVHRIGSRESIGQQKICRGFTAHESFDRRQRQSGVDTASKSHRTAWASSPVR